MRPTIRAHSATDRDAMPAFIHELQEAERAMHESRLPGREVAALCYERLLVRQAEILIAEIEGKPLGFVAGWLDENQDPLQTSDWRRHGSPTSLLTLPGAVGASGGCSCRR